MEDCWSHWGGLSLKWIVLFLQILSLKKNKKNIHRLGLSKASSESVNFVPTIEFHYTRQRRYTRVVQFHYTTMFFFFHVALSNNAQTIKTVLYFFLRERKISNDKFWEAAQCAKSNISNIYVIAKLFTLFKMTFTFYFRRYMYLGPKYFSLNSTLSAHSLSISSFVLKTFPKNKRSGD